MKELVDLLAQIDSPWNAMWGLLIFGVTPGFCLRAIVRLYPTDHPRRRELIGQLYALKWFEQPMFVARQLETAVSEGVPARIAGWRARRLPAPDLPEPGGPVDVETALKIQADALRAVSGRSRAVILIGTFVIQKDRHGVRITQYLTADDATAIVHDKIRRGLINPRMVKVMRAPQG